MKIQSDGGAGPKHEHKKSFAQRFIDLFVPQKGDSQKVIAGKIISIVAALLIIAALVLGVMLLFKYVSKDQKLEEVKKLYPTSSEQTVSNTDENGEPILIEEPTQIDPETGVMKEFNDLYKLNADVVGYIKIEGTKLDMPVVKGNDNVYYLNHTLKKEYDPFGVPFADYRTSIFQTEQSDNITIYGHAAADGTFFAPVKAYKDMEFYKEHPIVQFDTIYGKGQYKVLAIMMINTDLRSPELFNYHDYIDMDEDQFNYFIKTVREHSYYENDDVDVYYGDNLITLSTCDTEIDASNTTPYRMALVARQIRPGEKLTVDVSQVKENSDVIMPEAWQKKTGKKTPFDK